MSNTPVPKFTYPGDDPELDRLLNEARIEGAKELTSFPDMFGRRAEAEGEKGAVPSAKGPVVSTRPTVTEMPAGSVAPKRQARWLAFGALAIVGPVVALGIGALHPKAIGQGALPGAGSAAAVSAGAMVASGTPALRMTAVPGIEEDAGAVPVVPVTSAPSGARPAPSGPAAKVWSKIKDDPYSAAPKPAKTVEAVVAPPTPTVAPVPVTPHVPATVLPGGEKLEF